MSSSYGRRHGIPGYDEFRTGFDFETVQKMFHVASDDPRDWKYKSRGVVLGKMHELKMALYEQAVDKGYTDKGARSRRAKQNRPTRQPAQVVQVIILDPDDVF